MESLSFDSMVEFYDETRETNRTCLDSALDYVVSRFPANDYPHFFEPGIGTGRIAIPLAQRGYKVTGVDIAPKMVDVLRDRIKELRTPLDITCQEGDTTALPYADETFDAAIMVHLFYFIPEWKRAVDEVIRVVKTGGPLLLMSTGFGTEVPMLMKRYKELCAEQGSATHYIGAKGTKHVVDYLVEKGFEAETMSGRWQWDVRQSFKQAIGYFRSRAYSYTTFAPDDVHRRAIEQLETELRHEFGSLAAEVETPTEISLVVAMRRC